jgi:class 3 adenylate cyclase/alpha-beta hydrolase superfamily lysophospholipase
VRTFRDSPPAAARYSRGERRKPRCRAGFTRCRRFRTSAPPGRSQLSRNRERRASVGHTSGVAISDTRYAKSGEVHIAYRVFGSGPLDLVLVPGLTSNLDSGFDAGEADEMRAFGGIARCIIFDKRGTGISDRVQGAPSLEERMDDVRAVMDSAESSEAVIFGRRDGAAMSVLFAATYPARTIGLVLRNPQPRFTRTPDFPWAPTREEYDRETERQIRIWGTRDHAAEIARRAGLAQDDSTLNALARRMRLAASPGAAGALRAMNADIDVRQVLATVQVPTLVLYSPGREEPARYVADRMPDAELGQVGPEDADDLRRLEAFLARAANDHARRSAEPERVLATVLFTDLVGSTAKAVELGPEWQQMLREHNRRVRQQLSRYSGREIDTAGDGFFASGFDGPARAIRCGCAIRDAIMNLGLGVRVGVHTGECDIVDDKLSGLAVTIGARVAAQAETGEVLVSSTVRDLVAGSGIEFAPRGVRELKGIGEWPLYAVVGA